MALRQVSELEQPMDETDGVALMDSDFPEDSLPEKPANVVQVMAQDVSETCRASLMLCREIPAAVLCGKMCRKTSSSF